MGQGKKDRIADCRVRGRGTELIASGSMAYGHVNGLWTA